MVGFLVMVGRAVVMLRRNTSIVMVMDVRMISSPMAMENRAHGTKRKLLLSAAPAKRGRSAQRRQFDRHRLCQIRIACASRFYLIAAPAPRESGCPGACAM